MKKMQWNTVYLNSDVPEKEIIRMINNSYHLTKPKRKASLPQLDKNKLLTKT